ncbi:MAG: sodium-dependent transporter [Clostridia bacterium]|nr:sodium-dependent transporter [Clostridia bacterium]
MEKKKVGFASGIGFVLAAAGSAVGLGNLWGFPAKTGANGGAAFVLLYIASVLLIGIVAMIAEVFIGKRAQANPVTAYKKTGKNMGWVGLVAIIIPAFISCYYAVLGGYTVKLALSSFDWQPEKFATFAANKGDVVLMTAIFIILAMVVIMGGVKDGIEKASKVLMPALFVILVGLVVYALSLGKGVSDGLSFYLKPDLSAISGQAILAALGQAFYSLSLGMGIMVTYGSYAGKEINLVKSTAMICIFDTLVALLGGLAIFPSVFHYAAVQGVDATALGLGGMTLMFTTLPLVFADMGMIGQVLSLFFFAMVTIAALTSVISLLEVATQFVIQKFRANRKKSIALVAAICFLVSVPIGISLGFALNGKDSFTVFGMDLLSLFDTITNTVLMPVCAFLGCICVGWVIGAKKAVSEIEADGVKMGWFGGVFAVMVKYVTPLLITVVEIFGLRDLIFPEGETGRTFSANGLYIVLTAYALVAIGVIVYFIFFRNSETGSNKDEKVIESVVVE